MLLLMFRNLPLMDDNVSMCIQRWLIQADTLKTNDDHLRLLLLSSIFARSGLAKVCPNGNLAPVNRKQENQCRYSSQYLTNSKLTVTMFFSIAKICCFVYASSAMKT
jgi:hypothetical protein